MVTIGQLLLRAWDFEPSVLIGCALLLVGYFWLLHGQVGRKATFFVAGVLLMLLTLIGPLDYLGDDYLFCAHMLEHILLMLAVPPLLLLGLPDAPLRSLLKRPFFNRTERLLGRPVVAWFLSTGTLWIWHFPLFYNAALADERLHIFQHLTMLVTGTIFWWPVFSPLKERRMTPVWAFMYIFLAAAVNMILGILLTFSPLGYYPTYMRPADANAIFRLIRKGWEIDPQSDLNLGGMFMWIIGGLLYFWAMIAAISRLFLNEQKSADGE
jgi:cytochrome c oxidase assembly factor CtaG